MTTAATVDFFVRSVRERLFASAAPDAQRVGAEIEMLPILAESGLPCPLGPADARDTDRPRGQSTLGFLRPYARALGWSERRSPKGAPYFSLPNGAKLTFEPGGQLELCTPPRAGISALLRETEEILSQLRHGAGDAGISLLSVGIDPENGIERIPLQLASERYVAMTRYFDSIGPSGVRMMRQTAATQVSVDPGPEPGDRWRLLADLAPYFTAMFANSPRYAGQHTGWQSFRAQCWRELDPSRTGVPHPELPPEEAYARFALDATDMTRRDEQGGYRSFADWASEGDWTEAQWENHLTTLFPEARPRGHLEVRSIDAVDFDATVAAVVTIAGLVYEPAASREARSLVASADDELLNRAARCGLRDDAVASTAATLADLGLRGARSLGEPVIGGEELERAAEFVSSMTHRRRSPCDGLSGP